MCVFSAQYKFLHTIYVLFDVTTFTTYSQHFLCTDSSKLRLCVCSPWTKWPKIRKYLHLVVLYVVVKGSSSNGLDVPGVLSTCEPGLPSPPAQHNSKVFHKAGQHTNDHSYHHLYTLLLLNSIPSFNSV